MEDLDKKILYLSLHKGISELDWEPNDKTIEKLIINAINYLPDFDAKPAKKSGWILLRHKDFPNEGALINIQPFIDSIQTIWRDYLAISEKKTS